MSKNFLDAVKARRTHYAIGGESPISKDKIKKVIEEAVQYTPSAFNSQSARVVVLFGEDHKKLWSIVKETLRKIVPADSFEPTDQKINSFAAGNGTILYFENTDTVKELQEKFPTYKEHFPTFSQHGNAMLQIVIWTALEAEGLGASLQHYNPLIDQEVIEHWNLPDCWQLVAQMPFGTPTGTPDEKSFLPLDERIKVFE